MIEFLIHSLFFGDLWLDVETCMQLDSESVLDMKTDLHYVVMLLFCSGPGDYLEVCQWILEATDCVIK